MKGLLLPIAAPSGTGKTTVCHALQQDDERFIFSVSCTTRPPRNHERDGVDYHFVSPEKFQELIHSQQLIEWEQVFDHYYGTLKSAIEEALSQGKILLLDIDVKGALNIKKAYPEHTITIFLLPPSLEELNRRLAGRGTETAEEIAKRQARLKSEIALSTQFDHVIVNDHLVETITNIKKIIEEYFCNDQNHSV
jgi:guanylate kinase